MMADTHARPGANVHQQDWSTLTLEAFPGATAASAAGAGTGAAAAIRHSQASQPRVTYRDVYERSADTELDASHALEMHTDSNNGTTTIMIGEGLRRAWVLRVHLAPRERVASATVDGAELPAAAVPHLHPNLPVGSAASGEASSSTDLDTVAAIASYFPLSGASSAPTAKAGAIAELRLPAESGARVVALTIRTV